MRLNIEHYCRAITHCFNHTLVKRFATFATAYLIMRHNKSSAVSQRRLTDSFGVSKAGLDRKSLKNADVVESNEVVKPIDIGINEEIIKESSDVEEEPSAVERPHLDLKDPRYQQYLDNALKQRRVEAVHQEEYDVAEKLLRQFDLTAEYGPVAGLTRLQRWDRAEKLGLAPPQLVKEILETREGVEDKRYSESYLYGYL